MRHTSVFGPISIIGILTGCHPVPTTSGPVELRVTQLGKAGQIFTPQSVGGQNRVDAVFEGKHRAGPETSIDSVPLEPECASREQLFDTLPPGWAIQEQLEDLAGEEADPKAQLAEHRLPGEQRNVRVRAWPYAVNPKTTKIAT